MKLNKLIISLICTICILCFIKNSHAKTLNIDTLSGIPITFNEYMEKVTTHNLSYIAEKYNVDIMEAEIIVAQIGPDPELTIEGSKECFTLELGYTLEMGGANIQHV